MTTRYSAICPARDNIQEDLPRIQHRQKRLRTNGSHKQSYGRLQDDLLVSHLRDQGLLVEWRSNHRTPAPPIITRKLSDSPQSTTIPSLNISLKIPTIMLACYDTNTKPGQNPRQPLRLLGGAMLRITPLTIYAR